jgi:hypothetical protein
VRVQGVTVTTRSTIRPLALVLVLLLLVGCGFFADPQRPTEPPCRDNRCKISGYVFDFQDSPVEGVKIAREGAGFGWVLTDKWGRYEVPNNVHTWKYCLTPNDSGWTFEPPNRCYTMDRDYEDQNFTAYPEYYEEFYISGRVVDGHGDPVENVLITTEGWDQDPVRTDEDGSYRVDGLIGGWDYCVIPSKAGCTFEPVKRRYFELDINYLYHDFAAACN